MKIGPILIYAPLWRDSAAGIKVLYLLCHRLNQIGVEAYIVPVQIGFKREPKNLQISYIPNRGRFKKIIHNRIPVVVYSETIRGNPLKSKHVVRYILNYPGILSGSSNFEESDILLPYSKNIHLYLEQKKVLNLLSDPVFISSINLDEIIFTPKKQDYVALYASKYRRILGKPKLELGIQNVVEIFGKGIRKQKREETLSIIRNARALISFENSAIVTESVLSGTPVFLDANPLTENPIAEAELGREGVRPLTEFTRATIDSSEFVVARRKFVKAQNSADNQILRFLEILENEPKCHSIPPKIKIYPLFIRQIKHKFIFFRVFLTRLHSRYWA